MSTLLFAVVPRPVKQLVGHSKSMDTFGVYGHAVAGMEKQITSALDDVFGGILATQK